MSGTSPRVSIIMIFFNAERFIDEAIVSAMAQTFDDFELLLCNDGSTDGSPAIARRWAARHAERVRCLEHADHANRGMSSTRNLGLAAARGEFVAFIDADDVWHRDKLAEQVAIMEAHGELGMVTGTVRYWASWAGGGDRLVPTGHVRNRVVRPPEASLALYPLGPATAPSMSDMLLRREAVETVGRFEEQFTGFYEDQAFLSKLYLAWPVFFSDAVWSDYRQHPDSCSTAVARANRYDGFRSQFLRWFEDYLIHVPDEPPRAVLTAVTRAQWPYRRPVLHAVLSSPRRLADVIRGGLRRTMRRWSGTRPGPRNASPGA